jgi:aryl sulfotransferase
MTQNAPETGPAAASPDQPPVGWVDPEIQSQIEWRDGDIVISVPIKSGTTWTMNIVHQLRAGGDPDLVDVYAEVPWLELVPAPGVTREQRIAQFDAMPRGRRRAFKTHSPPGPLPYHAPGSGKNVKYVVVMRNPEEAVASLHPFIAAHSEAWLALWDTPREALVRPTFAQFFHEVAKPMVGGMLFGFAAAWWPLRHQPNVLFMHYTDMKADHEGSVRKIGTFLELQPAPAQWPTVLECTSFPWMKANEEKFEIRTLTEVPILDSGAMVRKGKAGAAKEDGVTPEIAAELAGLGRELLTDEAAFQWLYRGGPLPD